MHQVAENKSLIISMKTWIDGLTDEIYYEAIAICRENNIITGTINGTHYQTNSVLKKQKTGDEMSTFLRQLQQQLNQAYDQPDL